MAIALVHTTGANTLTVTIPSTTAGNCLVVCIASYGSGLIGSISGITLGGCTVKAWRALSPRPGTAGMGPTGLFPLRLRRPVMIIMFVTELSLGLGLAATAGRFAPAGRYADFRPGAEPGPRAGRSGRPDRRRLRPGARHHRADGDRAVLPHRRGRAERNEAAASRFRLRLLRRTQRHADRPAHDRAFRSAGRLGRGHDRRAPAPHAVLFRRG